MHEACEALGVPILTHDEFEADDVIGTLAEQARAAGYAVGIVTSDKDFFQLVRDGIRVFNPRDEGAWLDAGGVEAKFGVPPGQVVDVLALMGDAVDNVKGVPGIGEKGARELIAAHGDLDALLADPAQVARKRYRTALQEHAEEARLSRELVRIRTDVPVRFDAAAFRYQGPDAERCYRLFSALGFRTLVNEYAPTVDAVETDYGIVRSLEELEALVADARAAGRCSLHVLADGAQPLRATLVGLAVSTAPGRGRYIPLGHATLGAQVNLDAAAAIDALRPLLADPRRAQDRPRPQALRDGAGAPRRGARRPRHRHDDRRLPARRHPSAAPDRRSRAGAPRLQGDGGRRAARPRRQGSQLLRSST